MRLTIDRIAVGGDAIAHAPDGRIVFVDGGFPGDDVEVEVVSTKKRFMRAKLVRTVEAADTRTDAALICPVSDACGGCRFQELDYEREFNWKADAVEGTLQRIGKGVAWPPLDRREASRIYGYRSRAVLHVDGDTLGFFRSGSHDVVSAATCNVLDPRIVLAMPIVGELAQELRADEVFFEVDEGMGTVAVLVRVDAIGHPYIDQWVLNRVEKLELSGISAVVVETLDGNVLLFGSPTVRRTIPLKEGKTLVSTEVVGQFSQAHRAMNTELCHWVHKQALGASESSGLRVTDLFSGAGNLGLGLQARGADVSYVEVAGEAIAAARRNARKLSFLDDRTGQVGDWQAIEADLSTASEDVRDVLQNSDVVVLDPPRRGMTAELADAIGASTAHRVVYVSCDPPALARDVARLSKHGFRVAEGCIFDLFPRTPHAEVAAVLERDR